MLLLCSVRLSRSPRQLQIRQRKSLRVEQLRRRGVQ